MTDLRYTIPGKYKRAFSWRVSDGSPSSLQSDSQGMFRLATSDFPDILEDYLCISRKRKSNWTALSRLQIHMIEELLVQEGAVKHYKDAPSPMGAESEPSSPDGKPSQEVEFARQQLFFHRLYASAFRAIGDGIAWRALGYDRAVTRTLSEHQTKQTLASEGTIQELREWSRQFERGTGLAIFNALTNCLAVGDVTVVRSNGSVEIIEVKSSKTTSSRTVRQKQKMREVVSRLQTGEGQIGDRDIQIEILPITPETGLDRIEELLDTAGSKGWAAGKISNCLYVEAFDVRTLPDADGSKTPLDRLRDEIIGEWVRRGDAWTDMSTLDMLAFSPNCAPFSVYPFTPRTCVDLLVGAKNYTAYLNMTAVAREFENRGWRVDKAPKDLTRESDLETAIQEMHESFMRVSKGGFHADIPPADFARMQLEALRPKSLIEACEAIFKLGPREGGFSLALFEGESEIWD